MKGNKKTVLFLCTHNSFSSQMAEGLLNTRYKDKYHAFSAGVETKNVHPYAVEVMKEIGIDISKQYSKLVTNFQGKEFDYVVTVCDNAQETCPFFPGKTVLHKGFEDPSVVVGDADKVLKAFRRVRDDIGAWIEQTFGS